MKPIPTLLIAVVCTTWLFPRPLLALDQESIESTVKIFSPTAAKDGKGGIDYDALPLLPNGEKLNLFNYGGSGTGFVINDQGYVVSNNHVVAVPNFDENHKIKGFTENPNPLIYVVQKSGSTYRVHKAIVDWQSANLDVAIIHCPTLKARPLPLSFALPHESDHVTSCGFPAISDAAFEDREAQKTATIKLANIVIAIRIKRKEDELKRKLTDEEQEQIAITVGKTIEPVEIQWNMFLTAVNPKFEGWNSDTSSLDISSVVNSNEVWKGYFAATVTEGNIEKVMTAQGFRYESNLPPVGLIQHNLDIRHGNSGGPLLNTEGNVIGVVGRAWSEMTSGDMEKQTLATRITEAKKWIEDHHIAYVSPPWRLPQNFKVVAAVSLAIILALAACGLTLLRRRAATTSGYTTVIEDKVRKQLDAIMAKEHPRSPSPGYTPTPPLPAALQVPAQTPPRGATWVLGGRDAQGRPVRLELTEALLASRSDGIFIGRSAGHSQLVVNHDSISKQHAQLRRAGTAFLVSDRQSANGTAVNGRMGKPYEEMPLRVGDTLTLGEVKFQFTEA